MMRGSSRLWWAALLGGLVAGATDAPAQSQPKMGGTLRVALYTDATIPDPLKTRDLTSHMVMKQVCETLVTFDDDYKIIPQLADRWDIKDDGKTYVFALRKGVRFHDGKEMTAADVKYSLDRSVKVSPSRGDYAAIDTVTENDPYTVTVTLKQATPMFLAALVGPFGGYIVQNDLEKNQGGDVKKPICTGPYEYVEWQPDRFLRLKRFAGYSQDERFPGPTGLGGRRTAMLDEIIFRIVPDRSARVTSLSTGEVDFTTRIDVSDYERLKKNKEVTAIDTKVLEWIVLWFGITQEPTNDLKFRQAVEAAINYEELGQIAQDEYATVNASFIHPTQKSWRSETMARKHKHDPALAKKLLRESSYKGQPIELLSTREMDYMTNTALGLQQQLERVGIKVEVKYLDMPGLIHKVYASRPEYQLGMMSSSGRYDPDQHYFRRLHSTNAVNKYNSPEYDRVVEEARSTMDPEKRLALYDKAQDIIMRDLPALILFHPSFFDASQNYVKGMKPNAMGFLQFWNVWLDK
jgi:peptide/nickel transport system substrate-binding protein